MKCCKDCKHFQDANYSRIYISPVCLAHGGDDAAFMRKYLCGIEDARLYQPRPETREGTENTKCQTLKTTEE